MAIGDALGMPTEFLTLDQIAENYGWVDSFVKPMEWHPHTCLDPGSVTDDTAQALAIARAYSNDGTLSVENVSRELVKWAEAVPETKLNSFIGPSTKKALQAIRDGSDPEESGITGKTNGGAMRVAPVGIIRHGDPNRAVEDAYTSCIPTHNTTIAVAGSAAVAAAIAVAMIEDVSLEDVIDAGKIGAIAGRKHGAWAWGTRLEARIDLAVSLVQKAEDESTALANLYNYVGVDFLVAESVATAFGIVLLSGGDPMKACRLGANIGGDSDTVAAIAGAICGAYKDIHSIDRQLLEVVEAVNGFDLEKIAEDLVRKAENTKK